MICSRVAARRAARLAWIAIALSAGIVTSSAGTPSLVVDVATGKVIHAENATDPWYPASVTKLMTTYVALDMVRSGRAAMDTLLTLSAEAAAQPPSKMGLKPGTQITLENALKIIMVKSANDLAMMIGENLGGSVDGFAAMMNDTARRLGMRESRWYNPNGLPDARQQTSARDMAILARALLRDFPEQEGLFHIGAVQLGRNIMRNHNGMLGRYPGADGMKTGFICSGGFNIVASATQGGRRIIAVVMGYPSARERDLRAADLFDEGFSSFGGWGGQRLEDLPPSATLSPPDMRQSVCGPRKRQPEADDEVAVVQARDLGGNGESGIAALFSPTTLATPGQSGAAPLGRRTLGPRVAFTPIPVFLGPTPGSISDEDAAVKPDTVQIASRKVRVKPLSRSAGKVPASAGAYTPVAAPSSNAAVDVVKTVTRPASRAALQDNAAAKPAAETKPKLGALGGGSGRPGLGAIPSRREAKPAEPETAPTGKASGAGVASKPVPAKVASGKTASRKAAAAAKPSGSKVEGGNPGGGSAGE